MNAQHYRIYCVKAGIPEFVADYHQSDINIMLEPEGAGYPQGVEVLRVAYFSDPKLWQAAVTATDDTVQLLGLYRILGVAARFVPVRLNSERREQHTKIVDAIDHLAGLIEADPKCKELTFWKVIKCLQGTDREFIPERLQKVDDYLLTPRPTDYLEALKIGFTKGFEYTEDRPEDPLSPSMDPFDRRQLLVNQVYKWFVEQTDEYPKNRKAIISTAVHIIDDTLKENTTLDKKTVDSMATQARRIVQEPATA